MIVSFQMHKSVDKQEQEEIVVCAVEFHGFFPSFLQADVYLAFAFRQGERQDVSRLVFVAPMPISSRILSPRTIATERSYFFPSTASFIRKKTKRGILAFFASTFGAFVKVK